MAVTARRQSGRFSSATTIVAFCVVAIATGGVVRAMPQKPAARNLAAERKLAATVSESRMVETVRRLVTFGPRAHGSPANHEAAAWLASEFRQAGLEVTIHQDAPHAWYQPVSWDVRIAADGAPGKAAALKTSWPSSGSPSGKGEGVLSLQAAPGAVCLVSANPTPETTAGCAAVLFDGRPSASGWPGISRLRGTWTIPVFGVSPRETAPLRERVTAGEKVRVSFALEAKSGNDPGETVMATLAGKDRSKYVLFCAHGDSDSGGPGANDNASGVAIVLEIARAAAAAVKSHAAPQPAWDIRFVAWGGEMASAREYVTAIDKDTSRPQAVINFDQSGFGSTKDALYVEPDNVPVASNLIAVVRSVMKDHLSTRGFPEHAASVQALGGTDAYVFQNTRNPAATVCPAVTLYASGWDKPQTKPVTEGFPPFNWYADEQPGMVTVDGDIYYHSVGDTPANTTDTEPFNMGWCARVGLLAVFRLMET